MELLDYFKFPVKSKDSTKIKVSDIVGALNAPAKDKAVLTKEVSTITLKAVLTEDTTGIRKYSDDTCDYQAIYVLFVTLKDNSKIAYVNELFHKAFPNVVLMTYQIGDKYAISTAPKRLNQVEKGKTVIEEIQLTDFFSLQGEFEKLLNKISYDFINLKEFYQFLNNLVAAETIIKLTDKCPEVIDLSIKDKCSKIQELLRQKKVLELQMKEADSMQEKANLHVELKELELEIKKYE